MENPAYQAFQFLRWAFVIAPVIAGIDKFLMRFTNWTQYLWPPLGELAGGAQRIHVDRRCSGNRGGPAGGIQTEMGRLRGGNVVSGHHRESPVAWELPGCGTERFGVGAGSFGHSSVGKSI